jgi:hypothetical protein
MNNKARVLSIIVRLNNKGICLKGKLNSIKGKGNFFKIPFKGSLAFLYTFFIKGGFLSYFKRSLNLRGRLCRGGRAFIAA